MEKEGKKVMNDKQYLNENILKLVLQKLDEIKQETQEFNTIHPNLLTCLIEQAQQNA